MLPDSLLILLATAIATLFFSRRQSKAIALLGLILTGLWLGPHSAFAWREIGQLFAYIFLFGVGAVIMFSRSQRKRIALFVLSAFALVGSAGTTDLFVFYLFWEIACIASYFLAFSPDSKKAGFRYTISSILSSGFIFLAIALLYAETHSVAFSALGMLQNPSIVFSLLTVGFGLRSLIFPLHFWAPDLYSLAPNDTSALFAGLLSKLGLLGLFRMALSLPQAIPFLIGAGIVTMVSGNLFAFSQKEVKRTLTFSSVAHLGYLLIGLGMMTQVSTATILHSVTHAAGLLLAFLSVGREKLVSELSLPPLRRASFMAGILLLAGLPDLIKSSIVGSLPAGIGLFVALNIVFSLSYYWRLLSCKKEKGPEGISMSQVTALLILAVLAAAILLFPSTELWIAEVMG